MVILFSNFQQPPDMLGFAVFSQTAHRCNLIIITIITNRAHIPRALCSHCTVKCVNNNYNVSYYTYSKSDYWRMVMTQSHARIFMTLDTCSSFASSRSLLFNASIIIII